MPPRCAQAAAREEGGRGGAGDRLAWRPVRAGGGPVHSKNSVASSSGELSGMSRSMVDPVGSTSASKESDIVAFEKAQRTTLSAPQSSFLAPQFDEREEGTGDAHRLTSASDCFCNHSDCFCVADGASSPTAPRFLCRQGTLPVASCLCYAMCSSLVRPSDLDARSRAPHRSWGALAFTSDHPHPCTLFSLRLSLRESSSRSCEKLSIASESPLFMLILIVIDIGPRNRLLGWLAPRAASRAPGAVARRPRASAPK